MPRQVRHEKFHSVTSSLLGIQKSLQIVKDLYIQISTNLEKNLGSFESRKIRMRRNFLRSYMAFPIKSGKEVIIEGKFK